MNAAPVLALTLTEVTAATVTMASPSWWGADSTRHRGRLDGDPVFVKEYTPSSRAYLDVSSAISAATSAGHAGIAPQVVAVSPTGEAVAFVDLTDSHSTATLGDFATIADYEKLFALRAAAATVAPTARQASVFDDIIALRAGLFRHGVTLPSGTDVLFRVIAEAEARITAVGVDAEFRHGDGNISNLLRRREDGAFLLVDWDWAALMDPFQDLGSAIVELADDENHARHLFELSHGCFDGALFARSLLYGYADFVRQALIGALANHLDPGTFEYSKFSDWQFLRARNALLTTHADELLRSVSA